VEDVAEIILQFENGSIGSVHMDMIQRPARRSCRVVGTDGTIEWDGISHQVRLFEAETGGWTELHPAGTVDRNGMYMEQLQHFLDCVRGGRTPVVDGREGRRVLELALAAKESSRI